MKRITDKDRWIDSDEFRTAKDKEKFFTILGLCVIIVTIVLGILLIVYFI